MIQGLFFSNVEFQPWETHALALNFWRKSCLIWATMWEYRSKGPEIKWSQFLHTNLGRREDMPTCASLHLGPSPIQFWASFSCFSISSPICALICCSVLHSVSFSILDSQLSDLGVDSWILLFNQNHRNFHKISRV